MRMAEFCFGFYYKPLIIAGKARGEVPLYFGVFSQLDLYLTLPCCDRARDRREKKSIFSNDLESNKETIF